MMRVFLVLLLCAAAIPAAESPPRRSDGKYQVTLRLPADGLYAQEEVEIEVRLEDSSRPDALLGFSPVIRAQVDAGIEMPSMPGMPAYRETAHAEGVPGDYGFHPTFSHGGDYLLRLAITPPQEQTFRVEFPLHVLDAESAARRKKRPPRFWVELVSSPKTPKAGEPVDLNLVVRAREQPRQVFSSFDVAHEKLMHLVIVRSDLAQFAHEHPTLSEGGVFRLRLTFSEAGEYHLFADVAPKGAGSQVLMTKIKVSGKQAVSPRIPASGSLVNEAGGIGFEVKPPSNPLPTKISTPVPVSLRDLATGLPITDLENYLGATGHFILIHEDAVTFVHSHPVESPNPLAFLVRLPKAGRYRGWLQVQRHDAVVTAEFTLNAADGL